MADSYTVAGLHVLHTAPAPSAGAPAGRPPWLLVHGAGHGAWCWERWLERLPHGGWAAHALSLRGHPGSADVDRETFVKHLRLDDYADDVAAVAAHIGRPCVVVGHSLGGAVVQRFAARHLAAGGRLAALVLLAAVPPGALGPIRDAPLPADAAFELPPAEASQRYFHSAPPAVQAWALAQLTPESPAVMNEYSLGRGLEIAPEDITCPLLVVTAGHDRTAVPRDGRIAEFYGGEWLHAPDDGHDLMLEAGWAPLLDKIAAWVDAHAARD